MQRVTVILKKHSGNEEHIITCQNEEEFFIKISKLMREHQAWGYSRKSISVLTVVK